MPKRKRSKDRNEDLGHLMRKILRKLEKRDDNNGSSTSSSVAETGSKRNEPALNVQDAEDKTETPTVTKDDWLSESEPQTERNEDNASATMVSETQATESTPPSEEALNEQATESTPPTEALNEQATESTPPTEALNDLDSDILEILGEDPSATEKRGPDLRKELACRLQHLATAGLNKENRKDLIAKYPVPANCLHIDAPKLNLEIKAAIPETISKRDKGIETKQKQMASAISCVSYLINNQLNAKDKNSELLQKLMDVNRILCDIQHADSITRRNFILFALKKDMKEYLTNTKIDSYLFGESLAETLKTAKAVNKSGVKLKADTNKNVNKKPKFTTPKPLNQKPAAPARRPPPAAALPRSREPAATPRAPPPPMHSYRTLSHQPAQMSRRR